MAGLSERQELAAMVGLFAIAYWMPVGAPWFDATVLGSLALVKDYARLHVLTCLVPAIFIAGSISAFVQKDAVLRYLGAGAKRWVSYPIAAVSGAVLAVCSCTVMPLFAGIYRKGAGLGPAVAFLYAGPAINVAAMFLTARVLGSDLGLARAAGSILLAVVLGLCMEALFGAGGEGRGELASGGCGAPAPWPTVLLFMALQVGVLVVNGAKGVGAGVKVPLMLSLGLGALAVALLRFRREDVDAWLEETWSFAKLLLPTLFAGVALAGLVMPLVPEGAIISLVGENTLRANLAASVFGAFMYFATMTEVPIVQGLVDKGMHQGPVLALLLSGPSLSLPSMLVIRRVLGTRRTAAYVALVIVLSAAAGLAYGAL